MIDQCFRPFSSHFETINFRKVESTDISGVCRTSRKILQSVACYDKKHHEVS